MAFCPNCGTACDDSQAFCQSCGANLRTTQQPQPQQPYGQQPYAQQPYAQTPELGMKWFKFIIYVQLFLSALANLGTGISVLTGSQYGEGKELVYYVFSSLKTVDVLYGVVLIVLAVGAIYVRMQLAGYRANGPKLYLVLMSATALASFIYIIAASSAIGELSRSLNLTTYITNLIISALLIVINAMYFKKRAHLFVN